MDMKTGIRIATIRGIPIRIHPTFLLVLPFLAYGFGRDLSAAAQRAGVPAERLALSPWVYGLGVALALFASVLVHELAHSFYAIHKGGRVADIVLLPIGGVSEITEPPKTPGQEAVMALAGPATSLGLGVISFALLALVRPLHEFELSFAFFYLCYMNVSLGLFNLLPAFPMDGGRILRGILARKMGIVRATQIAAAVGKTFALLFAAIGFVSGNFVLLLIAFFVFVGGEAEKGAVLVHSAAAELRVPDVMIEADPVDADERVVDALRTLEEKHLSHVPVKHDGRLVGVFGRDELVEHVRQRGSEPSVH